MSAERNSRIEAAAAQAALLESLTVYMKTWQGDSEVIDSVRKSIVAMGKIAKGEG